MHRPAAARTRRAFSLLEVAAAAALFAVIAIGISLAVGTALANRSAAAIRHELTGRVDLALADLAHAPFTELLDNTFTPPEACPGDAFRGTEGRSCITVADREFEVAWSVSFGVDVVLNATDAASGANLVAMATLPDGSTLTRSRRVAAPTPGFTGDGVLRVLATGEYATFEGVLYLLDADTPTEVVATADMRAYGAALFRAPADACTTSDPCRLGLTPSSEFPSNGTVALAPSAVLGTAAEIVLTTGATVHRGVEFFTPASLRLDVVAESDTGLRAPAADPATICLWLAFNDGAADRMVPSCNDVSAGEVRFDSYAFDPAHPSFRAPLPPAVEATLAVDYPNGTCPDIGQFGALGGTFSAQPVCTSWTWGVPSTLEYNGVATAFTDPFRIPPDVSSRTVVFAGDLARPAIGYGDRPLWQNPRGAGTCATTASCTALLTTAPEDDICAGALCLASRVPGLTAPSTGTVYGVEVSSASTSFNLTVDDPYGDPVQVQLITAPQSGTLRFDDTPVDAGDIITTTDEGGPGTIDLVFDESETIDLVWFTIRLSNSVPDGVRDIDVALFRAPRIWSFAPSPATLRQSGSTTVSFSALATDSTPANGESVTITAPTGFTAPSTVTVASNGKATFTLAAGLVEPGAYTVELTGTGGRTASIPVTVSRSAGSVSVVVANLAQGAATTATATVRDVRGDVMEGANVSFTTAATASNRFATGVRTTPAGCRTDAAGVCTVELRADLATPTGAYTLTASTPGATASLTDGDAFTVTATVATVATSRVSVAQGRSVSLVATVRDGTGAPLAGRTVQAPSAAGGVSADPSTRTSDADGEVRFTLDASSAATTGARTLVFTVNGAAFDVAVDVTATPDAISVGALTAQRGATANGSATVLDAAGDPVEGAALSFTAPTGFTVATTPADANGVVSFTLTAASTAPKGVSTIDVVAVGFPTVATTFDVTVRTPPARVVLLGAVPSTGVAELLATVLDVDGDPVEGAVVELSGTPAAITTPPPTPTAADGVATLLLTDTGATPPGAYRASVRVTYLDTLYRYSLLVPVDAPATSGVYAPQALAAPTRSAATPTSVTLAWSLPAADGGAARTSVEVYRNSMLASVLSGTATTATLTGLDAETWYTFQIRACNVAGCSAMSTALRSMPAPTAPTSLAAVGGTDGTLALSWQLPTGSFDGLQVRFAPTGSSTYTTRTLTASSTTYTLRGLTNATEYTIAVATVRGGVYSWSNTVAAAPTAVPAVPTGFTATVVAGSVQLAWTLPSSNGAALTRIEIYRGSSVVETPSPSSTSTTDTPSAGTYRYAVAACNAVGCSPRTPAKTVVVP